MAVEQQIFLFRTTHEGVFGQKESHNLDEVNQLLKQGWRVALMSPTSSPSTNVGSIQDVYALIVLERGQ